MEKDEEEEEEKKKIMVVQNEKQTDEGTGGLYLFIRLARGRLWSRITAVGHDGIAPRVKYALPQSPSIAKSQFVFSNSECDFAQRQLFCVCERIFFLKKFCEERVTPEQATKSPASSVLYQNVMTMTMVMTSSPRMLLTFLLTSVAVGTLLVRGSHGCKTDECADLHAQKDFAWTSYSGMWIGKYVSNPMSDEENHGNIVDLEYSPNGKWRVKEYVGTKEGGCDILYWDCENPLGVGITNCTATIDGSRVQGVITIVATDYHTTAAVKVESRFVEHLYLMVRPDQALSADVISNQLKPCGDCIDPSSSFYKSMPDIVSICNLQ